MVFGHFQALTCHAAVFATTDAGACVLECFCLYMGKIFFFGPYYLCMGMALACTALDNATQAWQNLGPDKT